MYNVIIVDDEPVIRFGLKASVNWEQEGLNLIGEASNGQEALNIMDNHRVDILITDVKMPVMDGLTLMEKSLKRFPKIKVILVSSYADFKYAKTAIRLGAIDYVLKPTLEPEDFQAVIRKCVEEINKEREITDQLKLAKQTDYLTKYIEVEAELMKLTLSKKKIDEYSQLGEKMPGHYLVINMKEKRFTHSQRDERLPVTYYDQADFKKEFYSHYQKGACLFVDDYEYLLFINDICNPIQTITELDRLMKSKFDRDFWYGYSTISSILEAKVGFQQSVAACDQHFFHPDRKIFSNNDVPKIEQEEYSLDEIKKMILPIDEDKLELYLDSRYHSWSINQTTPNLIKQEACNIVLGLFNQKLDASYLFEECTKIKKAMSLQELFRLLKQIILECTQVMMGLPQKESSMNKLLEKSLNFIYQHYTGELTLQMVADHVHVSRNYFSVLFKEYSGQNFIDFVIELRIKKAEELLLHSSLRVYEVATQSGFNDVKYFSKLFKRKTGLSPVDFRTKG